jgi:thioredoxin 1
MPLNSGGIMAGILSEVNKDNFEKEVLNSSIPVIVDFWATWCMPCKMIAPVVEEISRDYAGKCKVVKLNIDDAMELATKFGVMNIPTIMFFKSGSEFSRVVGVVSKDTISGKIDEMLS